MFIEAPICACLRLSNPPPGWILVSSIPESSLGIWRKFFELLIPRNIDEHPTNLDPSAVPGREHLPRGRCGRCPGASFGHGVFMEVARKAFPRDIKVFVAKICLLFARGGGSTNGSTTLKKSLSLKQVKGMTHRNAVYHF